MPNRLAPDLAASGYYSIREIS